jgi:predicted Zn-ribbon and HTH transcriptional regulator
MKDIRNKRKAEEAYLARQGPQRCKQCGWLSSRLRRGGYCPRCVQIKEGRQQLIGKNEAGWPS